MVEREPNKEYVLALSYGKDSLASLAAIELLGWPLDRIIHTEIWATDTIPADLPPMIEFKAKADAIIKERWGIEVEHLCATRDTCGIDLSVGHQRERERVKKKEKVTYEQLFYRVRERGNHIGDIWGFPCVRGAWCKKLKYEMPQVNIRGLVLQTPQQEGHDIGVSNNVESVVRTTENNAFYDGSPTRSGTNIVKYLGIAADEPERIERHTKPNTLLPLVAAGWDEAYCRKWCEENDLLSPIYTTGHRGGCWFCHNQNFDRLRLLRKNYPDLWALLLKWDKDSPVSFSTRNRTIRRFDKRFQLEDEGVLIPGDPKFRWKQVDEYIMEPKENNDD